MVKRQPPQPPKPPPGLVEANLLKRAQQVVSDLANPEGPQARIAKLERDVADLSGYLDEVLRILKKVVEERFFLRKALPTLGLEKGTAVDQTLGAVDEKLARLQARIDTLEQRELARAAEAEIQKPSRFRRT